MKKLVLFTGLIFFGFAAIGQQFEEPKIDKEFTKLEVKVGADFAMQYQGLSQSADSALIPLGNNINLPTANLVIDAYLAQGIKVNLETYLSSRHHVEAWVKGGYLLMDELPFLNSSTIDNMMDYLTLKAGVMEVNFGDGHFRRSDNGNVVNNPFVGNYIMDAFTTAPAIELMYRNKGWLLMGAVSTGSLKPALTGYSGYTGEYTEYNMGDELAFYWKAGYDKELSEDFRLRATLSGYHNNNHHFGSLYYGERAGSRYYLVMQRQTFSSDDVDPASGHTSGRWGPGFTDENNAFMQNIFLKFKGLELFTTYETTSGTGAFSGADYSFNQYAVEGLYRFGKEEQFYAGGRYNHVANDNDQAIDRYQIGAGWFLTNTILVKAEYVNQSYDNFTSEYGSEAGFDGLMIEAAISF